ncbi:GNAT family N-acetyltransferase [Nitratireductor mangrovi]|uniref:GNAT family N-acetyltransferase n=1 Tax=Nitratireductor mangrovi TaxID=2599600 RepID=A0A5B8KYL6_9HYPH|nr:GNAT family N-acetyltransferase [Nitratireductor mangrovi]QDZ00580.1 GNAT family N-acetyltransferase [Nitratireductor mangrovi]
MTAVFIRPARDDDADEILAMACALARGHGEPDDLLTVEMVRAEMLADNGPIQVLIADCGEIAGYISLLPAFESGHASRGLYVADLYVKPEFRRGGVAKKLMAAAAATARAEGCGHLWLTMQKTNERAERFYRTVADVRAEVVAFAVTGDRFAALATEGEAARSAKTFSDRIKE